MNDPSRRTDVSASSPPVAWPDAFESLANASGVRTAKPSATSMAVAMHDAVAEAMKNPRDFPGVDQTAFEGDRVTIVAAPSLPKAAPILAAVVAVLADRKIRPTILISEHADPKFEKELQQGVGEKAEVVRHDPSDSQSRRYLAADSDDLPIYLDEALVDADWVLPIDVVVSQRDGAFEYPLFSDSETKSRLGGRGEEASSDEDAATSRVANAPSPTASETARQVRWLLGVAWHLRVAIDRRGEIASVEAVAAPATQPASVQRAQSESTASDGLDTRVATVLGHDPEAVLRALRKLAESGRTFSTWVLVADRWLDPPKSLRPAIDVAISHLDPERLYVMSAAGSAGDTDATSDTETVDSPFWKARATEIPDVAALRRLLANEDYEWTDWADV